MKKTASRHVIGRIRAAAPWADIAVINDGSKDRTGAIAEDCGAIVLHMPHNVGIGSAVQTGFIYARQFGYEVTVQNDGDGQHAPEEIPGLVRALVESGADLVIGSRYIEDRGYVTPLERKLGILVLSAIVSLVTRQRFTDPTSGFRASNRRTIELCAEIYPYDYPEPEAIVLLRRAGLTVREIPVTMNPRYGGKSSITPFRSIYYMIKVILAMLIALLRKRPSAG
ncbi:glycosyltransferase family 2 protein [Oscillatoria laete-virens NRMC-F 0139]|nr:glycosyltransferase family 2 protein [Oscillatoria laete-virens]MDL5054612.1 glycosyltransferase family 2 protein [Oscillatoria laete-virens NRMC-F 0139]